MSADAVVDLPGNELRMSPEILRDRPDDLLRILPENVAVQTSSVTGAFVEDEPLFVNREHLRMLFSEPKRRSGGGSAEHDLDARFLHQVHDPAHPIELEFSLLGLVQAPTKFAHA